MLFSTQTLRSIIAGNSAVDLPGLAVRTRPEALSFLDAYGVDLRDPIDAAHAQQTRARALELLESTILRPSERVPRAVRELDDLPLLLMWASDAGFEPDLSPFERRRRQVWSCVLLRVCHTLSHASNELDQLYAPTIRQQIIARFEGHLVRTPDGLRLGSGDDSVPLVAFDVRPLKTVEAATLKLLRAVENVAASIFDWMGVRLVTHDEIDAILAVRYLRAHHVIGFPNILPGRSRNSLIDLDQLEPQLLELEANLSTLSDKIAAVRQIASDRRGQAASHQVHNPHSASAYRAIQFTCREMVRLPIGPNNTRAQFFFPYEVQILDAASFAASQAGPASHGEYKQRQLEAVRARVLAGT